MQQYLVHLARAFVLAAVVVAATPGMAAAGGDCNLLGNPGFDEGGGSFGAWFGFGNVFINDPNSEPSLSPPGSVKMFGNFTGGFNVSGIVQAFPASEGQTYALSGWSHVSSADPLIGGGPPNENWAVMKIAFFDAPSGGTEIGSNEVIIADGATPLDVWTQHNVSAMAPALTQRVEALFLFLQPCAFGICDGGSVFVDDASMILEGAADCDDGDACTVGDTCIDGVCVGTPVECPEGEICSGGECVPDLPTCSLLANGGFDAGGGSFAGWFTFGNAFISELDEVWRSAPASGKMFGNFSGGFNATGMLQAFPASEGQTYIMTGWSHVRSADPLIGVGPPDDNWVVLKIVFFDAAAGGNEIGSNEVIIADGTTPQDVWHFNSVAAMAPAGTQRVEAFVLFLQPAFDAGAVFVDDVTFGLEEQCETGRSLIIKQGACPAPVNPHSNGVVPMVLTGQDDFNVADVDPASLDLHLCGGTLSGLAPLNGPPGPPIQILDLNHPFEGEIDCADGPCACNDDQSSDGIADLAMKFSTDALMSALGELPAGEVVLLELSGQLTDGTSFHARDCVVITPPEGLMPSSTSVSSNVGDTYVEITPLDLNVDSDGFTGFERAYNAGTEVTVTAPWRADGRRFLRWSVNGVLQAPGQRTLSVVVSEGTSLQAVYSRLPLIDHSPAGPPSGLQ